MHSIAITTECVADLPRELLKEKNIDVVYYDVETETGIFRDTVEINTQNIADYMLSGQRKVQSVVPSANDYKNFFRKKLEEYDEVIHISISTEISNAYENARLGLAKLGIDGRKIHLVKSVQLSSGLGLLVLRAVEYRDAGLDSKGILDKIKEEEEKISTSLIVKNVNYLYYNNKIGKSTQRLCRLFKLHPVLQLEKGKLVLKKLYLGSYKRATIRYVNYVLRHSHQIDDTIAFCTYTGCSRETLKRVKEETLKRVPFQDYKEQASSVTISCNCGPDTFGIIYRRK